MCKWVLPKSENESKKGVCLCSYPSILICIDQNELIPIVRPSNEPTPRVHHTHHKAQQISNTWNPQSLPYRIENPNWETRPPLLTQKIQLCPPHHSARHAHKETQTPHIEKAPKRDRDREREKGIEKNKVFDFDSSASQVCSVTWLVWILKLNESLLERE